MIDTSTPNRLRRTVTMPISCPLEVPVSQMYFMARIPGMLYAELGSALPDFKSPGKGVVHFGTSYRMFLAIRCDR